CPLHHPGRSAAGLLARRWTTAGTLFRTEPSGASLGAHPGATCNGLLSLHPTPVGPQVWRPRLFTGTGTMGHRPCHREPNPRAAHALPGRAARATQSGTGIGNLHSHSHIPDHSTEPPHRGQFRARSNASATVVGRIDPLSSPERKRGPRLAEGPSFFACSSQRLQHSITATRRAD